MRRGTRASLGRVLGDLGTTVLEHVHGAIDDGLDVGGVVIHDPIDTEPFPPYALVLGVGLAGAADIAKLLHELGPQQGRWAGRPRAGAR